MGLPLPGLGPAPSGGLTTNSRRTASQILTAPGERRRVGGGEVEAHHPEQCVQESFGLAQREMVEEPQGQGGLDGEIRVPLLPAPPAAPAGRPGSDRFRGQPHRHIAASNEGLVIGRPVRNAVLRLIRGMNLRLHPRSVAPAEDHEKCGPRRPTRSGYSCNNAMRVHRAPERLGARGHGPMHASPRRSRRAPRSGQWRRAAGAAEDLWLRYWSTRRLVLSRASNRQLYALSGARPAPGMGPWRRLRRPRPPAVR